MYKTELCIHTYAYLHIFINVWISIHMFTYTCMTHIRTTHLLDCAIAVLLRSLRSLPPLFHFHQHLLYCLCLQNLHHAGVWWPHTCILHQCLEQYHHPRTSSSLWLNVIDGCRNRPQEFVYTVEPAPDAKIINVERKVFQLPGPFSVCVLFDREILGVVFVYLCKCIQV